MRSALSRSPGASLFVQPRNRFSRAIPGIAILYPGWGPFHRSRFLVQKTGNMNHNRRSISPRVGHFRRLAVSLSVVVAAAGTALGLASTLPSPPPFGVYPVPGSRVVPPNAQIVFRGVTLHRLRKVVVTGSSTGVHTGTLRADSDGQGASFVPDKPFQPGETVTVAAALKPQGAWHGTFQYTVATPAGPIPSQPMPLA